MNDHDPQKTYVPSFADLLTTATTLINLDYSPMPWFSAEVRVEEDPRIQWLDLSEINQNNRVDIKSSSQAPTLKEDEPSVGEQADSETTGHYLDHIETVQQRDQNSVKKKRRRRKSPPKNNTTQAKQRPESPSTETAQKKSQATKSRHRKRSKRPQKPQGQS